MNDLAEQLAALRADLDVIAVRVHDKTRTVLVLYRSGAVEWRCDTRRQLLHDWPKDVAQFNHAAGKWQYWRQKDA